jgi:hypothetical protein
MSVYDIVRKAIRNKEIIVATYDGFVREMCPHVLGTKDGVEHALFLQVGGGSRKGLDPDPSKNWRCIKLDKLTNVAAKPGEWQTAPNYYANPQSCVDDIHEEVPH